MANKVYIIRMAAVAVIAAVAMTGCDSKQIDSSRTETSSALEIIADSSSQIESSSLNESSLNESSKSSKIESSSTVDSNSNAESSEIADSSSEVTSVPVVEEYYEPTYTEPVITQEVVTTQAPVEETPVEEIPVVEETIAESGYAPYDLYNQGRLYYGDYQYTWYSERVLPGYGLAIDGRHIDEDGFVCDGDGYICVASGLLDKGTVVDTPFGEGKVYDCGCPGNVLDIYVNW